MMDKEVKKQHIIVVPVYKQMTVYEKLSFERLIEVTGHTSDICLVCPVDFDESAFIRLFLKLRVQRFDNSYFKSKESYSMLCTTADFYEIFSDYEYMLIYQLDCWIFFNLIDYFVRLGYDYYGAPWYGQGFAKNGAVGNGGFSLRKISKFIQFCKEHTPVEFPEDRWFAVENGDYFNICPENIALQFSFETYPGYALNKTKRLPMGCHDVFRYDPAFFYKFIMNMPVNNQENVANKDK